MKPSAPRTPRRRARGSRTELERKGAAATRLASPAGRSAASLPRAASFFDTPLAWDQLRTEVLAPLAMASSGRVIRAWIPGCGRGEDAYSVAMALADELVSRDRPVQQQIFATDVDRETVEAARLGRFPDHVVREADTALVERWCAHDEDGWAVARGLRRTMVFSEHELLTDPPFTDLDLVVCRGLLERIGARSRQRALARFHFAISPGGYLVLGSGEIAGSRPDLFAPVVKGRPIYRRIGPPRRDFAALSPVHVRTRPTAEPEATAGSDALGIRALADTLLASRFAPAAALVDRDGSILHRGGPIDRYLTKHNGSRRNDLLAMCRAGLRPTLQEALASAASRGAAVQLTVRDRTRGDRSAVRIAVEPVRPSSEGEPLWLVTFEPAISRDPAATAASGSMSETESRDLLQRDLVLTRADLQATLCQLRHTEQTLRDTHARALATSEQLQAANEQLASAMQELEAVGSELHRVQRQLGSTSEELEAARGDLTNLLEASDLAIVVLDADLRIKRFTPAMARLASLLPTDRGRSILDLRTELFGADLAAQVELALTELIPVENEVSTQDADWYLRRVTPYCTAERRIDGTIVSLTSLAKDVQRVVDAEQRRMGQELHDGVAQDLTAALCLARNLADALGDRADPETSNAHRLGDQVAYVLTQVRALSQLLVPLRLETQGLRAALIALTDHLSAIYKTPCVLQAGECTEVVDPALASNLYRIAQEAMTNALKHAHASRIVVCLRTERGGTLLEIQDDGVGMERVSDSPARLGLRIMRHRARLIGAELTIESTPTRGTRIRCLLPSRPGVGGRGASDERSGGPRPRRPRPKAPAAGRT